MIESKELRIGNYVHEKDYGLRKVVKIDNRDGHDNLYRDAYGDASGGIIKPIPLTEEWLVKFGILTFKDISNDKDKGSIYFDSDTNSFYIYSGMGSYESYGFEVKCEYVHQLQNLYFALTGEELTIK